MYVATLYRCFYSNAEYKTVTVREISEIQSYCINGWRCINYTKRAY